MTSKNTNIEKKLEEIIPPNDYHHRYEFSNYHLIDALNHEEKSYIEDALIERLTAAPSDVLIIETLAYMRSKKALPIIDRSLRGCTNAVQKVIIATAIFKINRDSRMIDVAINSFNTITNELDLALLFSYLAVFNDEKTNNIIKNYIHDPNYIVSYNAKQALGIVGG